MRDPIPAKDYVKAMAGLTGLTEAKVVELAVKHYIETVWSGFYQPLLEIKASESGVSPDDLFDVLAFQKRPDDPQSD